MNLGFSAEHEAIRDEFRKVLAGADPRAGFEAEQGVAPLGDAPLWQRLAELGWLATLVPEVHGGSGLEPVVACVLAEEIGRSLAPVPFTSSTCAFTHGLGLAANADCAELFARLADGSACGLLLTDDCWLQAPKLRDSARRRGATLSGRALNVLDGAAATHALAFAGSGTERRLVLISLDSRSRLPAPVQPLDLVHSCASFVFAALPVQVLACDVEAQRLWDRMVDSYALFVAFEQLGGAEAALDAARRYSLDRYAFGRPIGSFQALKHLMADMLVSIDLARSNCFFGAAALALGGDVLREAAAVARISATEAFRTCAVGSTQVHGALGVTWESNCHLYFRRAQVLASSPGSLRSWKERLVALLKRRAETSHHKWLAEERVVATPTPV
jgi:acyl-CoA dehydrogenase